MKQTDIPTLPAPNSSAGTSLPEQLEPSEPGRLPPQSPAARIDLVHFSVGSSLASAQRRREHVLQRVGHRALQISLAVVFIWFGGLKLTGHSPVTELIDATLPGPELPAVMPVLGVIEVLLGIGLLIGWPRRLVLATLVAHLCGTFLSFVFAPDLMVQQGNPLALTTEGEFVLKNMVLVAAAIVLLSLAPTARSSDKAVLLAASSHRGVARHPRGRR